MLQEDQAAAQIQTYVMLRANTVDSTPIDQADRLNEMRKRDHRHCIMRMWWWRAREARLTREPERRTFFAQLHWACCPMPDVHVRTRAPSGPLPSFLPLPLPLQPSETKHIDWGGRFGLSNSMFAPPCRHNKGHGSDGFGDSVERCEHRFAYGRIHGQEPVKMDSDQL